MNLDEIQVLIIPLVRGGAYMYCSLGFLLYMIDSGFLSINKEIIYEAVKIMIVQYWSTLITGNLVTFRASPFPILI